jgi:uncharacterized protein (DUF362 family)
MRRDEEVVEVFLIKTSDRDAGIRSLLSRYDLSEYSGKRVALKANFNSADPFPASTHIDTLGAIVKGLKGAGASEIKLAERSGMGDTRTVLKSLGAFIAPVSGAPGPPFFRYRAAPRVMGHRRAWLLDNILHNGGP